MEQFESAILFKKLKCDINRAKEKIEDILQVLRRSHFLKTDPLYNEFLGYFRLSLSEMNRLDITSGTDINYLEKRLTEICRACVNCLTWLRQGLNTERWQTHKKPVVGYRIPQNRNQIAGCAQNDNRLEFHSIC